MRGLTQGIAFTCHVAAQFRFKGMWENTLVSPCPKTCGVASSAVLVAFAEGECEDRPHPTEAACVHGSWIDTTTILILVSFSKVSSAHTTAVGPMIAR